MIYNIFLPILLFEWKPVLLNYYYPNIYFIPSGAGSWGLFITYNDQTICKHFWKMNIFKLIN